MYLVRGGLAEQSSSLGLFALGVPIFRSPFENFVLPIRPWGLGGGLLVACGFSGSVLALRFLPAIFWLPPAGFGRGLRVSVVCRSCSTPGVPDRFVPVSPM